MRIKNLLLILLALIINIKVNSPNIIINEVSSIKYASNNQVSQVNFNQGIKFLAVNLRIDGEYEFGKTQLLTCRININKMVKIIYIVDDEEIGYKYVYLNKPVGELLLPTKMGYNFAGWTKENNEAIDENTVFNKPGEYKLYAHWNILINELEVDPKGGMWNDKLGIQSFNLHYLEELKVPNPTRVGYTFLNWELNGQESTLNNKIFKMGIEKSSLKANWEANTYNLIIDPNEGMYQEKTEVTKLRIKFDSITTISDPIRKGYTFTGWSISNGELNGQEFFMNYPGDVTLTANWVINDYNYIIYHQKQSVDGSRYNVVPNDTISDKAPYETILTPKVNKYTGFTSPAPRQLKIDIDTNPPAKNILIYRYTRNMYDLTIDPNEGFWNNINTPSNIKLYYNQSYYVDNPTRTGYNFINWNKSTKDSGLIEQEFRMGLSDTILKAIWEPKTYTLTFDVNGGDAIDNNTKIVTYDAPFGELPSTTRYGYTFGGWFTEKDGGTQIEEETIYNYDDNITLYAHWNIIISELAVDPNGGMWNDSIGIQTFNLAYLDELEIANPTRVGYTFLNWELKSLDSSIINKVFKMGTSNSSLKAIWTPNEYNLNIDPNHGIYEGNENITNLKILYDSTTTIKDPTRKGYTFTGWSVSNGELNGQEFFMNYPGDVTLTANWVVNDYEYIVYHQKQSVDGSSYNVVSEDTKTGKAPYETVLTPEVNYYIGFNTPNKRNLKIDVDTKPPVKNILTYNYDRQKYTLTINPNQGSWNNNTNNSIIDLYYEQTYNVMNPVRTGYNFNYWDKDTMNSTLTGQVFKMGLSNTILTALWTPKTYTLTYNVNGGNSLNPNSKTITYDQPYGELSTPSRQGYSFLGWFTAENDGTQVYASTVHKSENNVNIYAHWNNTPPTSPKISISYKNGTPTDGLLKNGEEIATVTITSSDIEDTNLNFELKCRSGSLCNYVTITKKSSEGFKAVYEVRATKIGIGLLEAVATDSVGLSANNNEVLYVFNEGGGISNDNAKFTNTYFDSDWLDAIEGCYISDFTFTVQFASGHSNGSSDKDYMRVTGKTESGEEIELFYWDGNMKSDLHESDTIKLSQYDKKIVSIKFYTYSPHDDCARSARITYSARYTFDKSLLKN